MANNFEIWKKSFTFEIATREGGFSSTRVICNRVWLVERVLWAGNHGAIERCSMTKQIIVGMGAWVIAFCKNKLAIHFIVDAGKMSFQMSERLWTGCCPTHAFDPQPRSSQQIAPPYRHVTTATCNNFLVDKCIGNEKVSVNLESRKLVWGFDDKNYMQEAAERWA